MAGERLVLVVTTPGYLILGDQHIAGLAVVLKVLFFGLAKADILRILSISINEIKAEIISFCLKTCSCLAPLLQNQSRCRRSLRS
jgi:hypothetical protein